MTFFQFSDCLSKRSDSRFSSGLLCLCSFWPWGNVWAVGLGWTQSQAHSGSLVGLRWLGGGCCSQVVTLHAVSGTWHSAQGWEPWPQPNLWVADSGAAQPLRKTRLEIWTLSLFCTVILTTTQNSKHHLFLFIFAVCRLMIEIRKNPCSTMCGFVYLSQIKHSENNGMLFKIELDGTIRYY